MHLCQLYPQWAFVFKNTYFSLVAINFLLIAVFMLQVFTSGIRIHYLFDTEPKTALLHTYTFYDLYTFLKKIERESVRVVLLAQKFSDFLECISNTHSMLCSF